jgi:hypothetical protein
MRPRKSLARKEEPPMPAPPRLVPGTRVRILQAINSRCDQWTTEVEGEVISHQPEMTGSWYVHGKGGRLWLDRIRLRKDDGEITTLNLTRDTCITILKTPESQEGS